MNGNMPSDGTNPEVTTPKATDGSSISPMHIIVFGVCVFIIVTLSIALIVALSKKSKDRKTSEGKINQLESEKRDLEGQLREKDRIQNSIRRDLDAATQGKITAENEVKNLAAKNQVLQNEVKDSAAKNQILQKENNSLKTKVRDLQNQNKVLKTDFNVLDTTRQSLQVTNQMLGEENVKLQDDMEKLQNKLKTEDKKQKD